MASLVRAFTQLRSLLPKWLQLVSRWHNQPHTHPWGRAGGKTMSSGAAWATWDKALTFSFKRHRGVGKMVWYAIQVWRSEFDSQNPRHTCNHTPEEGETGPGAPRPAGLTKFQVQWEILSKSKVERTWGRHPSQPLTCAHTSTRTHACEIKKKNFLKEKRRKETASNRAS